jgi:hypothetical protein
MAPAVNGLKCFLVVPRLVGSWLDGVCKQVGPTRKAQVLPCGSRVHDSVGIVEVIAQVQADDYEVRVERKSLV